MLVHLQVDLWNRDAVRLLIMVWPLFMGTVPERFYFRYSQINIPEGIDDKH